MNIFIGYLKLCRTEIERESPSITHMPQALKERWSDCCGFALAHAYDGDDDDDDDGDDDDDDGNAGRSSHALTGAFAGYKLRILRM